MSPIGIDTICLVISHFLLVLNSLKKEKKKPKAEHPHLRHRYAHLPLLTSEPRLRRSQVDIWSLPAPLNLPSTGQGLHHLGCVLACLGLTSSLIRGVVSTSENHSAAVRLWDAEEELAVGFELTGVSGEERASKPALLASHRMDLVILACRVPDIETRPREKQ